MKYKDIFKNIWFWTFVISYFVIHITTIKNAFGEISFLMILGSFVASFLTILIIASISFLIGRLIKKVTKR